MSLLRNSGASMAMIVVFTAAIVVASGFKSEARVMPMLVAGPGLAFSVFQLVSELRRPEYREALSRRELQVGLWFLATTLMIILFGFAWGAPVMVAVYFHFILREKAIVSAAATLVCILLLDVLLNRMMDAQLFEGLVRWYL